MIVNAIVFRRVKVSFIQETAPGVFLLSIPRRFDFIPGQSVSVTVDPSIPPRSYSIASGRADPFVELLFNVVPEGLLTPRLARLGPGDDLLVSAPFGAFRDDEGPSAWVATGTGVAPFASMIRSGRSAEKTLIHGSRQLSGLFFHDLFASVLGSSYIPCCSAEEKEAVFHGRVTAYLRERPLPPVGRYLLCGGTEMVVDVRDLLISRGVPFSEVNAEIYF
jgi:NAD(P)H-flavin reductase